MKKTITLLLAILLLASLCACGSGTENAPAASGDAPIRLVEDGKLIVVTEATFPPYEMPAEDGVGVAGTGYEGIEIELAAAIAERLGLELVVEDMPYDSALLSVQEDKADLMLAGMGASPDLKSMMLFSDVYTKSVQVVVVPEGSEIENNTDLLEHRIGTIRNTTAWVYSLDDWRGRQMVFDWYDDAVQALRDGKVDALVLEKSPAEAMVKAYDGYTILEDPFTKEEYVICMDIDNPGLQRAVNQALADMREDGTLDGIIERFIPANPF